MNLSNAGLTGAIPLELSRLTLLRVIELEGNSLSYPGTATELERVSCLQHTPAAQLQCSVLAYRAVSCTAFAGLWAVDRHHISECVNCDSLTTSIVIVTLVTMLVLAVGAFLWARANFFMKRWVSTVAIFFNHAAP